MRDTVQAVNPPCLSLGVCRDDANFGGCFFIVDSLRRPPDAGEREDAAGFVVGLVVDLDVMANKGVEVEQTNGDVGAVGLIAGLLGEAPPVET